MPGKMIFTCGFCALLFAASTSSFAQLFDDLGPMSEGPADSAPDVKKGMGGALVATWTSLQQGKNQILTARSTDRGDTWSDPISLTDLAPGILLNNLPSVATDSQGNWNIVWHAAGRAGADFDLLVSHSSDNGVTWTPPAVLNINAAGDIGDDIYPHLAADPQGHWVCVWRSNDSLNGLLGSDDDILYAVSQDGLTWSPPQPLNSYAATDAASDQEPRVATDGQGNWVASWHANANANGTPRGISKVLTARSSNNGSLWTAPELLNVDDIAGALDELASDVAFDVEGGLRIVWQSGQISPLAYVPKV